MSNVQTEQQRLPAAGVTCPHCGETTVLSQEELRRVIARRVAKHGSAALASDSGGRQAVPSAVASPHGIRTRPTPRPTPPTPQASPAPQSSSTPRTAPATETPPTPQNGQLREDGIWKLDRLLGPTRLRGTGAAHWLRPGAGGRNPLHAGRFYARGAAFQLDQGARDLALIPSEHGIAYLVVDGLADGSGSRDELFQRADEIAQCHGGLPAYRIDPDTGAQREKPLLSFACSNSGRGHSQVVVHGLRGWLVERYPLKVVDVQTWCRALSANTLRPLPDRHITEKRRTPAPEPETAGVGIDEFRSWLLPLPDDWLRRAPPGTRREDGWLANAEIWAAFEKAFETWGLSLDGWNTTRLALQLRQFPPLGRTRMLGSGNAKRRGRYELAWRGDLGSLLLRP